MDGMFLNNPSFNQPIGLWDTSSVTEMYDVFNNATSFEQNIGSWNITQVTDMTGMLENVNLTTANYDALLQSWSTQTVQSSVVFSAGLSQYSNCSIDDRAVLTGTYSWTVTDGGLNADYQCEPIPTPPTSITGAVTKVNNSIVSVLVALIIMAVLIGITGLVLGNLGMMSKQVMIIMGVVLVALVLIILVLSFQMIGVV
jgi:surface protein